MQSAAQGHPLPQSEGACSEPGQWSIPAMAIGIPSITIVAIEAAESDDAPAPAETGPDVWKASTLTTARIERHRTRMGQMFTIAPCHETKPLQRPARNRMSALDPERNVPRQAKCDGIDEADARLGSIPLSDTSSERRSQRT